MSCIKRNMIFASVFFFLFGLCLPVKPAAAAYMTSIDLIRTCTGKNIEDKKICHGYIAGIIDYHNLARSLGTAPTVNFCVPQHLTISEVTFKVMSYLRTAPQHDYFIASPAVALALYHSFPCSKVPKPSRRKK